MAYITPLSLPIIQNGEIINEGHFAVLAEKMNELINAHNEESANPYFDANSLRYFLTSGITGTAMLFKVNDLSNFSFKVTIPNASCVLGAKVLSLSGYTTALAMSTDSNNPSIDRMMNLVCGTQLYDPGYITTSNTITNGDFTGNAYGILLQIFNLHSPQKLSYEEIKILGIEFEMTGVEKQPLVNTNNFTQSQMRYTYVVDGSAGSGIRPHAAYRITDSSNWRIKLTNNTGKPVAIQCFGESGFSALSNASTDKSNPSAVSVYTAMSANRVYDSGWISGENNPKTITNTEASTAVGLGIMVSENTNYAMFGYTAEELNRMGISIEISGLERL